MLLPMNYLVLTFSAQLPPSQILKVIIIVKELVSCQHSTHARFLAHIIRSTIMTTLKGKYDYYHLVEEIETQGG